MTTTMIARHNTGDAGAHCGNHAGCLVAVDSREFAAPGALGIRDVGVADGTGFEVDENFTPPWRSELERFDREGFAERPAYGGLDLHGNLAGMRAIRIKAASSSWVQRRYDTEGQPCVNGRGAMRPRLLTGRPVGATPDDVQKKGNDRS